MSVDSRPSLSAFSSGLGNLPYPLLSDFHPKGKVSQLYGIWNEERGLSRRACFLIDREGVIRWKKVYERGLPTSEEVFEKIAKLPK